MKFESVLLENALGKILGHNVSGANGRRVLRKGNPITMPDIVLLRQLGRKQVYVAILEQGDVLEDEAAKRIAQSVAGPAFTLTGPATGRVNIYAQKAGLLRVNTQKLGQLNLQAGVTLATLPTHTLVPLNQPKKVMVGTVKILPYALPNQVVEEAKAIGRVLQWVSFPVQQVALVLSGSPSAKPLLVRSFEKALRARLEPLNATLAHTFFVGLQGGDDEETAVAQAIAQASQTHDMVIVAGETATQDRYDIGPRAIERAGGVIECFGAPVDPGNLLVLAYKKGLPIVGAPGCARSPKKNIIDWVLPRLLVGDKLTQQEIAQWGHGGLLEDVLERPLPRARILTNQFEE